MGGNALKSKTCRLNKSDFTLFTNNIISDIKSFYPNNRVDLIKSYNNKEDFGDADILIESIDYNPFDLAKYLNATEVVRNGNVTSIGINTDIGIFQVDLIATNPDFYDFSIGYFGYNDLGNLLGRIYHKFGFKFGHKGLLYVLRDPQISNHVICEIVVTRDFNKALELLQFNPFPEFNYIEDIFEYVIDSKYFNPSIFKFDNLNHIQRVRDKKRKTYNLFLKYIENLDQDNYYSFSDKKELMYECDFKLKCAMIYFPQFSKDLIDALYKNEVNMDFKIKFNGNIVSEYTGLSGKELGKFISYFKTKYTKEVIILLTENEIKELILLEFQRFTQE